MPYILESKGLGDFKFPEEDHLVIKVQEAKMCYLRLLGQEGLS